MAKKENKAFQSYLTNIEAKTGKTPAEFRALAAEKRLTKNGEIVKWLKQEFDLGHGHANAMAHVITQHGQAPVGTEEAVAAHFTGKKVMWREPYDALMARVTEFGKDVGVGPTKSYISLLRGDKKFGIVQVTAQRMDIGIKLKGVDPSERLEEAGSWNAMVTHRVCISEPEQIDSEVIVWLKQAYAAA